MGADVSGILSYIYSLQNVSTMFRLCCISDVNELHCRDLACCNLRCRDFGCCDLRCRDLLSQSPLSRSVVAISVVVGVVYMIGLYLYYIIMQSYISQLSYLHI